MAEWLLLSFKCGSEFHSSQSKKGRQHLLRRKNTQVLLSPKAPPVLPSADLQTLRTVLAVFGKGCLSSSFACLFLYTSELYPTVIR